MPRCAPPAGRSGASAFGYGQELYFWSLLAAVGTFVAGAGCSVFEGVLTRPSSGRHRRGQALLRPGQAPPGR